MLKLLIADDEPKIRRGLQKALNWGELGIEVAGFAENGQQALEMVEAHSFDIGLIDVCMPIVNGLDFIEKLKSKRSDMVCIVVSGHDEFEFTQHSIRLNVFDYLLKPAKVSALEATVRRAVEYIESRDRLALQAENARKLLVKNLVPLREKFLRDMASGVLSPEEIGEHAAVLSLNTNRNFGLMMASLMGTEAPLGALDERTRQARELIAQNLAVEIAGAGAVCVIDDFGNLILLVPGADETSIDRIREKWENLTLDRVGHCIDATTRVIDSLNEIQCQYVEWIEEKCAHNISPFVQELMRAIEARYSDADFNLEALSRTCHVSGGHLSRLFRQETGMTFTDCLIRVRIRKATCLLATTNLMVYEVAARVGYNSQHYFCAAFKRLTGLTPTEYRENGGNKHGSS